MECDMGLYVALAFISIALTVSMGFNFIFYSLRRRDARRRAVKEDPYPEPEAYHVQCHDCGVEQENPIYGNINSDGTGVGGTGRGGDLFYEHMTTQAREEKPSQQDVSYASLDLMSGQKRRKKHKNKQHPKPAQNWTAEQQLGQQELLEAEAEVESGMPCRENSTMLSRNSIYLNSQQIAFESEELERRLEMERQREDLTDFDSVHDDPVRFMSRANQFELDSS
ncbi:hypothetical protein GJAV_G00134000 [Gymnothorax javanicus]|nr:hypothetical protein GJAV_G00134000 [Gymnothorax javanicus]